jgi:hypothetical protein
MFEYTTPLRETEAAFLFARMNAVHLSVTMAVEHAWRPATERASVHGRLDDLRSHPVTTR